MPSLADGRQLLKCFCSYKPTLAVVGIDPHDGRAYVHQKVYKGDRIYSESYIKGGEVSIRCRECLRWHQIFIREDTGVANLKENSQVQDSLPS